MVTKKIGQIPMAAQLKHFGLKALDLEDEKLRRLEKRGIKYTQCVRHEM